jgi:hypothetical protein
MQQLGSLSTPRLWLSFQVKQCFASSIKIRKEPKFWFLRSFGEVGRER